MNNFIPRDSTVIAYLSNNSTVTIGLSIETALERFNFAERLLANVLYGVALLVPLFEHSNHTCAKQK